MSAAGVRVADGVLDQVSQHLRNPDRIGVDSQRSLGNLNSKCQPFRVSRFFKLGANVPDQLAELECLNLHGQLTCIASGDREQVAQLPLQHGHGVPDAADRGDAFRPAVLHGQQLRRGDDVLQG